VSEFSIRRYRREDREAVERVMEAALRDADAYVEDAPALSDGDILAEYVEAGGDFLVGTVGEEESPTSGGGDVVATAAFRPPAEHTAERADAGPRAAELKRMHVHPAYQRRGFATRLLSEVETRAAGAGFEELVLETTAKQDAAAAFYRGHGFELVGEASVPLNEETITLHYYRKPLGER